MKISVSTKELREAIERVIGAIGRSVNIPILDHLLLETDGETVSITATDMEIELVTWLGAEIETEGSISVPGKKLLDMVRSARSEQVQIEKNDTGVFVRSGRPSFRISYISAEQWPRFEEISETRAVTIPDVALKNVIARCGYAVPKNDSRYYLNGLLMIFSADGLRVVGTDGHRLATCLAENAIQGITEPIKAIVPNKAIQQINRVVDQDGVEIKLQLNDRHIRVTTSNTQMTASLISGRFPDYERVVPKDLPNRIDVSRESFEDLLRRASIVSKESFGGVRISADTGLLRVYGKNRSDEEIDDEIEISYAGTPAEVGFNANYLLDALGAIDTEGVTMEIGNSPELSGIIRPKDGFDSLHIVMPMRL